MSRLSEEETEADTPLSDPWYARTFTDGGYRDNRVLVKKAAIVSIRSRQELMQWQRLSKMFAESHYDPLSDVFIDSNIVDAALTASLEVRATVRTPGQAAAECLKMCTKKELEEFLVWFDRFQQARIR